MSTKEDIELKKQILETQQAEMRSLKPNASVYRQMVNNSNVFYLTTPEDIRQHLKKREQKLQISEKNP